MATRLEKVGSSFFNKSTIVSIPGSTKPSVCREVQIDLRYRLRAYLAIWE